MKNLYLILAVLGAVVPYAFFLQLFAGPDALPLALLAGVFANPAASGATADLLISSLVFWIYLFAAGESRRAALLIPVNLLIGLSCALPLYLYLRSRAGERPPLAAGGASGQLG